MNYGFIIYTIVFFFILIFFLYFFIKKTKKIYTIKIKLEKKQISEICDNKFFVFSDGTRTKLFKSNFNENNKKIYFFIHDIYGISDTAIAKIKNSKNNIISFVQHGFDDNLDKSFSLSIAQISEILDFFKKKYPDKEQILFSEGFGSKLAYFFVNKNYKIIFVNPILDIKTLQLTFFTFLKLYLPYISKLKKSIFVNFDLNKINIECKKNNQILKLNYLYLYNCNKIIRKFKISNNKNIVIYQTKNSYFYNELKTKKNFKNVKLFENNSNLHLLSESKYFDDIFNCL